MNTVIYKKGLYKLVKRYNGSVYYTVETEAERIGTVHSVETGKSAINELIRKDQ
jgi:hypothetical protein